MVRSAAGANPAPIEDPTEFYALILSGKQGRAVVRSFIETTVRDVARNVERWRGEACIVRPFASEPGGFSLRDLRSSLAPRGDVDLLSPAFGTALFLSIVLGRSFPASVLPAVVSRNRCGLFGRPKNRHDDERRLASRSCLLKAWFQRNRGKEMPVSLDPDRPEVAYRLGRLLAALDKIQGDALGNVNATLVDRYFGSASATPAVVFPTLIRRSQSHLSTLRREKPGLAVVRERLLQDIVSDLARFPKTLNLEDQGLFSLGFYQQRQAFFTKKEEN
jgi:CRISPR-associated protein Csd1